jgi:protein-disulfide isomerase
VRALAFVLAIAAASCRGAAERDPELPPLPSADDVDDRCVELVEGPRVRVPVTAEDPQKGAVQPLVVVVELSDFQCPFCGRLAEGLDEIVRTYPDDVRLVFKQFPLRMHPDAELGARAALAAQAQGRFWAMHDRLFATRQMKRDATLAHAREIGLDEDAFAAALDDPAVAERVAADRSLGASLGVRSTPTFFVNGRPFAGALEGERLRAIVEEELAAASRLVEAGCERATIPGKVARAATSP